MASKEKTTMSVPEMRQMLGLKKTESYWLVHKNFFKTRMIAGKMRINIESFEKWYSCQTHYKKVDGPTPGAALNAVSYSVHDISKMLGISTDSVYELLERRKIETFSCDNQKRVEKRLFDRWLRRQAHYRTPEQREQDREAEESTMSLPEMGRLIFLSRNQAYALAKRTPELEIISIAGQRRVTKTSFEKWYSSQKKYRKYEDMTEAEQRKILKALQGDNTDPLEQPNTEDLLKKGLKKEWYSIKEAAEMLGLSESSVKRMIYSEELGAEQFGRFWRISREDIVWLLKQQQAKHKEESENGIDR